MALVFLVGGWKASSWLSGFFFFFAFVQGLLASMPFSVFTHAYTLGSAGGPILSRKIALPLRGMHKMHEKRLKLLQKTLSRLGSLWLGLVCFDWQWLPRASFRQRPFPNTCYWKSLSEGAEPGTFPLNNGCNIKCYTSVCVSCVVCADKTGYIPR